MYTAKRASAARRRAKRVQKERAQREGERSEKSEGAQRVTSPGPSPLLEWLSIWQKKKELRLLALIFVGPEGPMFTGRIKRKIEQRKFLSPQGLNERIQPALFARKYRPRRLQPFVYASGLESTGSSTQEGGAVAVGSAVHRGGLRRARGGRRTSSRVTPRAFSRTKDGSRRCILSRDSNIGTHKNSRTPDFARNRPGRSCGLTGALKP
jgi:hypothetical protein